MTSDNNLMEWRELQIRMKQLKSREIELRKLIVQESFDPNMVEGTETIDLGNDYKLKCRHNLRYNVERDNEKVLQVVSKLPVDVAKRILKWKADLSLTEYKQLDKEHKKLVDKIVTTVPGSPVLELVEPKS